MLIFLFGILLGLVWYQWKGLDRLYWSMGKEPQRKVPTNELALCKNIKVNNWVGYRRRVVITVDIYAKAEEGTRDQLESLIKEKKEEIQDQIRSVVSGASFYQIIDPYLTDISGQLHTEIDQIVGPGKIDKLLFPRWHISAPMLSRHRLQPDYLPIHIALASF